MTQKTIISIIGVLGVGKTTLAKQLQSVIPNSIMVDEPVERWLQLKNQQGNNLLDLFYHDKKRWTYLFQNVAFITRLQSLVESLQNSTAQYVITDSALATDKNVYAQMLYDDGCMDQIEWSGYQIWEHFYQTYVNQHKIIYVYLKTNPEIIIQRIRQRGRPEEQSISLDYLSKLQTYIEKWITSINNKVIIIDYDQVYQKMDQITQLKSQILEI